jgi:glycine betaine/choline ABC-type transport system substrate-binding protein
MEKHLYLKAYKEGTSTALPLYVTAGTTTYDSIQVYDDSRNFRPFMIPDY